MLFYFNKINYTDKFDFYPKIIRNNLIYLFKKKSKIYLF